MKLELKNKTIIIISQEDWGDMFISKHHYAIELSKRGNKVFYINSPDLERQLKRGEIKITSTRYENIKVISHRLFFPFFFKEKYTKIYNFLIQFQIKRLLKKIGIKPDIIWSFDLSNATPLCYFPEQSLKIFMPVDAPTQNYAIAAAKGANTIFSVTNEILDYYNEFTTPKHFINHGVADYFISTDIKTDINNPIRIGYSGGLLRNEIDWDTFFTIIKNNPDKVFDFWGEYDFEKSFISKSRNKNETIIQNIEALKSFPNVKLHGVLNATKLFDAIKETDVLMICYDIKKDQSHGTNYHKILEYLGTGKVVISNNVSTYSKNYPGVLQMATSRENNEELPVLFSEVTQNIDLYNARQKQEERINFAKEFTYTNQINKVEFFLQKINSNINY